LDFLYRFSKNLQILNSTKIHAAGYELFHADRQTDMMMLIVAFRNFTKAPKKAYQVWMMTDKAQNNLNCISQLCLLEHFFLEFVKEL